MNQNDVIYVTQNQEVHVYTLIMMALSDPGVIFAIIIYCLQWYSAILFIALLLEQPLIGYEAENEKHYTLSAYCIQDVIADTCQVFSLEICNSYRTHLRFRHLGSEQSTQQRTNYVVSVAVSASLSPLYDISKHLHLMRIKGNTVQSLSYLSGWAWNFTRLL